MCGRFVRTFTVEDLVSELEVEGENVPSLDSNWNIPPTSQLHVIGRREDHRVVRVMEWGLIPKWAKDDSRQSSMINARVETAHEKPAFRGLVRNHRVVIPMSGFYEWDRSGATKVPYYFSPLGKKILPVAGLWTSWSDPEDGQVRATCAILTTQANGDMAGIHDRMPCLLNSGEIDEWLDPAVEPMAVLEPLRDIAVGQLDHRRVSTRVNSVRNNDASLLESDA